MTFVRPVNKLTSIVQKMKHPITIRINEWHQIFDLSTILSSTHIFRGQANSSWEITSSLERALTNHLPYDNPAISQYLLDNREYWMLREFKRKFHLYSNDKPKNTNNFEWLAIMQHHGCPTRLVDFSNSLFIALYFAVSNTTTDSAIWCINTNFDFFKKKLNDNFNISLSENHLGDKWNNENIKLCNKHIGNDITAEYDFVIDVETKKFNKRSSAQQGLFIMPLNPKVTFKKNLYATYQIPLKTKLKEISYDNYINNSKDYGEYSFLKLVISKSEKYKIMKNLLRMNITSESLFPDLDGFSRSLIETIIMDDSLMDGILESSE